MKCFVFCVESMMYAKQKGKKFNSEPAVRFKHKSIEEHCTSQQHKAVFFQKEFEEREKSKEDVYFNALLNLYCEHKV